MKDSEDPLPREREPNSYSQSRGSEVVSHGKEGQPKSKTGIRTKQGPQMLGQKEDQDVE